MAHVAMHCAQCCIFAAVGFIIIRLILKWLYLIGLKKHVFNAKQYCLQFLLLLDLHKYNWLLLYTTAWGLILNDHWFAEVKSEGSHVKDRQCVWIRLRWDLALNTVCSSAQLWLSSTWVPFQVNAPFTAMAPGTACPNTWRRC